MIEQRPAAARLSIDALFGIAFPSAVDGRLLLAADDPSTVPPALRAVVPDVSWVGSDALESDRDTSPASGAILHHLIGNTLDEARAPLQALYGQLPADAPVLILDAPAASRVLGRRDLLATALYAEGFVAPRFSRSKDGGLAVRARRSREAPPYQRDQVLSVVMPVYNERETFAKVIDELLAKEVPGFTIEVIIVESNSNDGTREEVLTYADHPKVRLVLEEKPSGKGHAVRAGIAAARGDFVLIQDADLEYEISDYDALLGPLSRFETSFVLGYRMRTTGARFGVRHFEKQVLIGLLMNVGNAVFLRLFNTVYGSRLRDPFTMYKVFRRDCVNGIRLECNRFDFDWELTGKLLRSGYHPLEIPVTYQSRSFSEGKKVSILGDPWSWVVACFKYRFGPIEEPEETGQP